MHYLYDSLLNTYCSFESSSEAETVCGEVSQGEAQTETSRYCVIADGSAAAVAIDFATKDDACGHR